MPNPTNEFTVRAEFMRFQKEIDKETAGLLKDLNGNIENIISRNADASGIIPPAKMKLILAYSKEAVAAYEAIYKQRLVKSIKQSAVLAIKGIGDTYTLVAARGHKLFDTVYRKTLTDAVARRGVDGLKLSDRVWDLKVQNQKIVKRVLADGIATGKSATQISRDIRGYLVQPETLRGKAKDLYHPGQGVYKSAYKNAMRVTRSETNNAYIGAQVNVAKVKGWKLKFNLSGSHSVPDICDAYNGKLFAADNYPGTLHPHCLCFPTMIIG